MDTVKSAGATIVDHEHQSNGETEAANLLKRLKTGVSVPDEELRKSVRNQLQKRLSWGIKPTHKQQLSYHLDFIKALKVGEGTREHQDFYELPGSFLKLLYGATLKESCSYFKDESTTLDEAEIAANDLCCERAQIQDGQSVLDIGCGQGSFVFHVAQKFKNCHVTGVTNAKEQIKVLEERRSTLGLSNVDFILEDVTKLEMESTFDRIFFIQALEHMNNIESLLRKVSGWMKDDGLLFVDSMIHKVFCHHFERIEELGDDLFSGYLFPGGMTMLSHSTLLYFQDDVSVVDHWTESGKHLTRTMEAELKKLDKKIGEARNILEDFYKSKEVASQMITYWRTLLIAWSEQFNYNNGEEWMVAQILFKKK